MPPVQPARAEPLWQKPNDVGLDPGVIDDLADKYGILSIDVSKPFYTRLHVRGREQLYPLSLILLAALTEIKNGRQEAP